MLTNFQIHSKMFEKYSKMTTVVYAIDLKFGYVHYVKCHSTPLTLKTFSKFQIEPSSFCKCLLYKINTYSCIFAENCIAMDKQCFSRYQKNKPDSSWNIDASDYPWFEMWDGTRHLFERRSKCSQEIWDFSHVSLRWLLLKSSERFKLSLCLI